MSSRWRGFLEGVCAYVLFILAWSLALSPYILGQIVYGGR